MQIDVGYFYFVKDDFFDIINDSELMKNKENGIKRPCYYCFKSKENDKIIWFVPVSTKVDKYKKIYENKIQKQIKLGKTPSIDTIVFGYVANTYSTFLIQNMFPVTEEYKDIKLKHVFLSIFPENDKTYIILSWTKQNSNIFREYKKQLEALTEQERKNYINNIIPLEIENVVVNPDSWEKLERGIKDSFGLAYNGAFIGFDKLIYENILQNPGYDFFSL